MVLGRMARMHAFCFGCLVGLTLIAIGCDQKSDPVASHATSSSASRTANSTSTAAPTATTTDESVAPNTAAAAADESPSVSDEQTPPLNALRGGEAPILEAPSAEAPSAEGPTVEASTVDESTVDESTVEASTTDVPSAEVPAENVEVTSRSTEPVKEEDSADEDSEDEAPKRTPLFEGWAKPKIAFVFTGSQHGYIEPCGCTGLANQRGGLARRDTFLRQLTAERGWAVVPLDVGDQVRRFGRQAEIKFQFTLEGLKTMGYQAIAFGPDDLHLSIDELAAITAQIGNQQTPFVAANVAVFDRDLTPRFKVIEAGGMRIGVTSILGDNYREKLVDEVLSEPAAEGLKKTWKLLAAENCDYHILLAHASSEDSIQLARTVPHFDLVVTSGGSQIPSMEPIPSTKSQLVEIGEKAMFASVVGLFDDPLNPVDFEYVPLDSRFADSQDMLDLMKEYQRQLEQLGLDGLGVRPLKHPSGRKFVGSEKCGECHRKAFEIWEQTPHHEATASLVNPPERSEIPRHFDPECLSCHVTGWNPQRYVPYDSGYLSLKSTPLMTGNGCENCHGPGSAHVAAEESGADDGELKRLRDAMKLSRAVENEKDTCMECHDHDNSPEFNFDKYWDQIKHVGKD